MHPHLFSLILLIVVTGLGLITGSFLNAVIHRLPRGISLLHPKRSFCPGCKKTIPWHENIPVASWIVLRGKCSGCTTSIGIRYPLVELLTGAFYLLVWERFEMPLSPIYWVFLSLLIAATFIDYDLLIIPDEITLGGTVAGLVFATLVPQLLGAVTWWQGFVYSFLGALLGFLILWGVVELGKVAFGRQRINSKEPLSLELSGRDGMVYLKIDDEEISLDEFLYRGRDKIKASCFWLEIAGERLGAGELVITQERVKYGDLEWPFSVLPDDEALRAEASELVLPREAMGFGDVKFLACIGAFLGWKGVLFSVFAGSLIGAIVGVAMLVSTHGRSGGKIPFGPYLALGAMFWVFGGPELIQMYLSWIQGGSFLLSSLLASL